MSGNPFEPPSAPLRVAGGDSPQPVRGVVLGLLVYVAGSFVLVNLLLLVAVELGLEGAPRVVRPALVLTSALNPLSTLGAVASGAVLTMSFVAGYVCATFARSKTLIAPTVVATVAVSLELYFGPGAQPTGLWLGLTGLTFVLTLVGGLAWVRQELRDAVSE
ncbi:MAG: hypothetical protein AAGD86_05880 [Pseudomonadota bacterium]